MAPPRAPLAAARLATGGRRACRASSSVPPRRSSCSPRFPFPTRSSTPAAAAPRPARQQPLAPSTRSLLQAAVARSATVWSANVATAVQPMSTRPAASAVCQHTRCAPVPRAPIGVTPRRHRGHAACSPAPAAKSAALAKMLRLLRLHRAARRGGARIIRRFGAASTANARH